MNMSPQINELAKALSIAQGQMRNAKRDASNPFYKSNYSTLGELWNVAREPLCNNGLSLFQETCVREKNAGVITMLAHSSGQFVTTELFAEVGFMDKSGKWNEERDVQSFGSHFTYLRRYAMAAILGIASDDDLDDKPVQGRRPVKNDEPIQPWRSLEEDADEIPISREQGLRLKDIVEKNSLDVTSVKDIIQKYGYSEAKYILRKDFDDIEKEIKSLIKNDPKEGAIEEKVSETEIPQTWKDVVVTDGKFKGKKLGSLSNEELTELDKEFKPRKDPKSKSYLFEDMVLRNGINEWKNEAV